MADYGVYGDESEYSKPDDNEYDGPAVGALGVLRPDAKGLTSVYDTAIQRLKASRSGEPSQAEKLFAISAALGSPTRTGTLGETFGNLSKVLGETTAGAREARQAREDKIAALEFAKAKELAQNEARFAELQMRYGTPKPASLVFDVYGNGRDRYTGKVVAPAPQAVREETRRGVVGQVDPKGAWTPLPEYAQPNKTLKPVPKAVMQSYLGNQTSARTLDSAIAAVEAYPKATGLSRALGDTINQRLDPQGVDARAGVADVGSLLIHDRSGAAVTISESPRLMPFVPQVTDDPKTVLKKLKRLKQMVADANTDIEVAYDSGEGYQSLPSAQGNRPRTREAAAGSRIADRRAQGVSLKPAPPEILAQARAAIAKGAPREAVAKRLKEKGFAPGGL